MICPICEENCQPRPTFVSILQHWTAETVCPRCFSGHYIRNYRSVVPLTNYLLWIHTFVVFKEKRIIDQLIGQVILHLGLQVYRRKTVFICQNDAKMTDIAFYYDLMGCDVYWIRVLTLEEEENDL